VVDDPQRLIVEDVDAVVVHEILSRAAVFRSLRDLLPAAADWAGRTAPSRTLTPSSTSVRPRSGHHAHAGTF
jgi:hypothetical protein